MQSDICRAVLERRIIEFTYKGTLRTVEPHMVAFNKNGELTLSAWFLHGSSESREGPGWRAYLLSEISNLALAETTFSGPRPGYRADGGKSFTRIQCAL